MIDDGKQYGVMFVFMLQLRKKPSQVPSFRSPSDLTESERGQTRKFSVTELNFSLNLITSEHYLQ